MQQTSLGGDTLSPPALARRLPAAFAALALALGACQDSSGPHEPAARSAGGPHPAVSAQAAPNSWEGNRASMLTPRWGLVAAAINNTVYAIGGRKAVDTGYLRTVEAYNPDSNVWTYKAPLPRALAFSSGAVPISDKIYVPGGLDTLHKATKTLYVYSTSTNSWARKADIPVPSYGGAVAAIGGKVYVLTPVVEGVGGPFLHRYDPATNSWTTRAAPPHSHYFPAGYGVITGKFYVAGAYPDQKDLDVYDPSTNSWQTKAPMPTGREAGVGRVINGKLYVVGGFGDAGWLKTLEVYDPANNSWTQKADMPTARDYLAGAVAGGKLYAVGGLANGGIILRTNEVYTP